MKKTLLFVFALYLFSIKNFAQVNVQDSTALVDLYNSTDGANWTNKSNWLTTAPLGTWKGVTVEGGRVTWLDLYENHLVGSIPSSFENLTALKDIAMGSNQLTGTIPAGIGSFPDLTGLALSSNQLTGAIPPALGSSTKLRWLVLSNNLLTGEIPVSLTDSKNYDIISLGHNQLSGKIPLGFGDVISSFGFDVSNNQLSGPLPDDFGNLETAFLNIEHNQLSGDLPVSFGANFAGIYMDHNQFTFEGIEALVTAFPEKVSDYDFQKTLSITNNNNATLSVTAGGTLSNNTYTWYKDNDDAPYQVITGDSAIQLTQPGTYWVVVTNSEATRLALSSETIEISSVLPLTWLNFTASNCSHNVCLQWQTVNEQHTSHFEIERSVDGKNFIQRLRVASQNIPGAHVYNATDDSPAYGANYYRIKQVDLDGRYSYSDIISVGVKNAGKLTIRPNPANNFIMLSGIDQAERVILYNMSGQMLRQWQHVAANQQLYISDLQKGMYIIKVLHRNGEAIHKIIKQ